MTSFATKRLPREPDVVAPDGSDVRILVSLRGGGMARFTLAPGETSPEPLAAIGVTMPPWPGDGEASAVEGRWAPTVRRPVSP